MLEGGEKLAGYEGNFYWSDIGTLEAYRAAQHDALSGKVRLKIPGERRSENLWVDCGTHLHPTVALEGRVVLGQDAVIGRGVTLIGDTTVGSGCWVRPGAAIKRCILLPGSSVGDGAYLKAASSGTATTCAQEHRSEAEPSSAGAEGRTALPSSGLIAAGVARTYP